MTEIKTIETKVPLGTIITTQHLEDGKVVRQDVEVNVTDPAVIAALTGQA